MKNNQLHVHEIGDGEIFHGGVPPHDRRSPSLRTPIAAVLRRNCSPLSRMDGTSTETEAAKMKREWCCFICFSVPSNLNRMKRSQGASTWERFVSGRREHEEDIASVYEDMSYSNKLAVISWTPEHDPFTSTRKTRASSSKDPPNPKSSTKTLPPTKTLSKSSIETQENFKPKSSTKS
ncbi:hypothetical protein QJS10_CPA08g01083 [Acorus calamus]|uniref:Uncharacterized protein n=1 Tax=Acorus calamus TaxID=4465 RepID=A0AAV9E9F0_ACOCL|nr:hypothetical protein QJS10_CPA08g01083 [Acorus calamus]